MSKDLLAEILKLTPSERIQIVEDVWDSLAPEDLEVTEAQMKELNRRVALSDANPERGIPWERIKKELSTSR